jgi:hypothetical protein
VASNFNDLAVWPDAQNGLSFANVTMPQFLGCCARDERPRCRAAGKSKDLAPPFVEHRPSSLERTMTTTWPVSLTAR